MTRRTPVEKRGRSRAIDARSRAAHDSTFRCSTDSRNSPDANRLDDAAHPAASARAGDAPGKRLTPIGAVAGAATLILTSSAAQGVWAQSLFGQVFTPAPPDTETVIDRNAENEEADQERAEALRRVLNFDAGDTEGPVVLEADTIEYDPSGQFVVASGDVEVFYAGRTLRADELRYDGLNDTIDALGDIRVVNNDGSVLVADEAQFDFRDSRRVDPRRSSGSGGRSGPDRGGRGAARGR